MCRTPVDTTKVQSYPRSCQIMICSHFLYKILDKEEHRHSAAKSKSVAIKIFLDLKEVCAQLDNGLSERIISSICFSEMNI